MPVGTDRTKKLEIVPKQTNFPKALPLSLFPVKFILAAPSYEQDTQISRISILVNLFGNGSLDLLSELQMWTHLWPE